MDIPIQRIAVAVIVQQGKILIDQRPPGGVLAGLWEFPGGKIEASETAEQCAVREALEEVGLTVKAETFIAAVEHDYGDKIVQLQAYLCRVQSGEAQALECSAVLWIRPEELEQYPFPPLNAQLIKPIRLTLDALKK